MYLPLVVTVNKGFGFSGAGTGWCTGCGAVCGTCGAENHKRNTVTNNAYTQCLKIAEKVASALQAKRATFIKNAKNGLFLRVFENLKLSFKQCYHTGHF